MVVLKRRQTAVGSRRGRREAASEGTASVGRKLAIFVGWALSQFPQTLLFT